MAATVIINRWVGPAPGTSTPISDSQTLVGVSDALNFNLVTEIVRIPHTGTDGFENSGQNYSAWVSTRLQVVTPPTGTINNIYWFTDGSNNLGTGVMCYVAKASTGSDAGYRQSQLGPLGSALPLNQTNHSGLDEAPQDAFLYSQSGTKKRLQGALSRTSGHLGDFVVYQFVVDSSASSGPSDQAEPFYFQYDET